MSNALNDLGLTLRQDFQTWLMQLQIDALSAEQPLSDQVDQLYQLVQDLTACEQISESWWDLEAWLTSEFLPSDAVGVSCSSPDPLVPDFFHFNAQAPTLPFDLPRMKYPEHSSLQGLEPVEPINPIVSSAPPPDSSSPTSRWLMSSSVTTVDRDQQLFVAEGDQTPAVIDRAVAEPTMPNQLAALSVLPDRAVLASPPSGFPDPIAPPVLSRGDDLPSLELPPASADINLPPAFTPESSTGAFPRSTSDVKGMKELSAFLQQAKSVSQNVSAPADLVEALWTLPGQAMQHSSQPGRSHELIDPAEVVPLGAVIDLQPKAFGPSPTHNSITEMVPLSPTVENTTDSMWQQIKANAITGRSEPVSQPTSGLINAPMSAPMSEQGLDQSATSLNGQPYLSTLPQRDSNLPIQPNPSRRDSEHGLMNWTQDGRSQSLQQLVPSPLPQLPSQTDLGLRPLPNAPFPSSLLPQGVVTPDAWPVGLSPPSSLDLDGLLEALQNEINQDYDRFYGS